MTFTLAICEKVKAVNFLGKLFVSADGKKPTPCYTVKVLQSPVLIFPPQYEVVWEQASPCIQVITPFHVVGGPFPLPSGEKSVRVSFLRDGKPVTENIPIEIVKSLAERGGGGSVPGPFAAAAPTPGADTARGFSDKFSFEEAFRNAIANLPERQPSHPDELETVRVREIGAEFGSIAGFNQMFVEVERTVF